MCCYPRAVPASNDISTKYGVLPCGEEVDPQPLLKEKPGICQDSMAPGQTLISDQKRYNNQVCSFSSRAMP